MRILLYDIENSPNVSYTWGFYEQNVIEIVKNWELLSVAYKWLGEDKVHCITRQGEKTDKNLTKKVWKLINESDVVIAHNGLQFDNKKVAAKFIEHGLKPPKPYKSIDTKEAAKRAFRFNSNKLDELGKLLKVGRKMKHQGFDLWQGCMNDDPKAWRTMIEYNKQDVLLLERVYLKLRPWISAHPVTEFTDGTSCVRCKGKRLQRRGIARLLTGTYWRYQCVTCGGWQRERKSDKSSHIGVKYKPE